MSRNECSQRRIAPHGLPGLLPPAGQNLPTDHRCHGSSGRCAPGKLPRRFSAATERASSDPLCTGRQNQLLSHSDPGDLSVQSKSRQTQQPPPGWRATPGLRLQPLPHPVHAGQARRHIHQRALIRPDPCPRFGTIAKGDEKISAPTVSSPTSRSYPPKKHRAAFGPAWIERIDLLQHSYNVPMRKQRIWLCKLSRQRQPDCIDEPPSQTGSETPSRSIGTT